MNDRKPLTDEQKKLKSEQQAEYKRWKDLMYQLSSKSCKSCRGKGFVIFKNNKESEKGFQHYRCTCTNAAINEIKAAEKGKK